MALISALHTSFSGLKDTEARLAVTSQNVTNADKPGYTRKTYASDYTTTNDITTPNGGTIVASFVNQYLQQSIIQDLAGLGENERLAEYLSLLSNALGNTAGGNTVSAALDDLEASFDLLSVNPEDGALKQRVVADAETLALQIRQLSADVQDLRQRADQDIEQVVGEINDILSNLDNLNGLITFADSAGNTTADLEDERNELLEQLAELIDIDYFFDSNNQLNIYAANRPVLGGVALPLTYTAASNVSSTVVYPGGFAAIDLNGNDLTTLIGGGELAGLIEMRDTILVEEQAKLDEFARVLMEEMNDLLNQGATIPPRSTITGYDRAFTPLTAFAGTGNVRIAVVDTAGLVQSTADFNLAGYATINDILVDINATLGPAVTASLTVDGEFQLVANNAGEGIAMSELNSDVTAAGESFSEFFGLHNLFEGTGGEDIILSRYLQANSDFLSVGFMQTGALVAGDQSVFVGDGSLAKQMNQAFQNSYSFNAAGNFAAQTESINDYAEKIMGGVAIRGNTAQINRDASQILVQQSRGILDNETGVNIDEEMTMLIDLEAKFEAAATVIARIQEMFDQLLAAVR